MKRLITLSLSAVLLLAALAGCSSGTTTEKQLTPEERTTLYKTSIENARDADMNEGVPVVTSADEDMSTLVFDMLGVTEADMTSFGIAISPINIRAYGIAAILPAPDKSEAVLKGLQAFVDNQKQSFQQYLVDQYEVASNAKLETLEDGTLLLVMSEDQDTIFNAIKTAIEAGK